MASSGNVDFGVSPMQKKDCIFLLKYGTCSFGKNCRYNHPPREEDSQEAVQEGSAEMVIANYTRRIPCKFYRTGNCKYGSYCGFNHSMPPPPVHYNSDGLPMRLGEKVCSYYMEYHLCGYGVGCKFHHPEINYFVPQEYGSQAFGQALEYHDGPSGTTAEELLSNNE